MSISQSDIKKLYGLSAGRCNICGEELIEEKVHIGEMAHIIAKNSGGPRGEDNLENDNSYENLILLCPTHHTKIDKNPKKYTVRKLHEYKRLHEDKIRELINNKQENSGDVLALNYLLKSIPFLDLFSMAFDLPGKVSVFFETDDVFENFCRGNPHLYPFEDEMLNAKWNEFMSNFEELESWILGSISGLKLITIDDMLNHQLTVQGYNIYVTDDSRFMVLNKKMLTLDQLQYVREQVTVIRDKFIHSQFKLVQYIRFNLKGVKLK